MGNDMNNYIMILMANVKIYSFKQQFFFTKETPCFEYLY